MFIHFLLAGQQQSGYYLRIGHKTQANAFTSGATSQEALLLTIG